MYEINCYFLLLKKTMFGNFEEGKAQRESLLSQVYFNGLIFFRLDHRYKFSVCILMYEEVLCSQIYI